MRLAYKNTQEFPFDAMAIDGPAEGESLHGDSYAKFAVRPEVKIAPLNQRELTYLPSRSEYIHYYKYTAIRSLRAVSAVFEYNRFCEYELKDAKTQLSAKLAYAYLEFESPVWTVYPNYKGRMSLDGLLWIRRAYCDPGFDLPSDFIRYFSSPMTLREIQRHQWDWEQFSLNAFLRSSECLSGQ